MTRNIVQKPILEESARSQQRTSELSAHLQEAQSENKRLKELVQELQDSRQRVRYLRSRQLSLMQLWSDFPTFYFPVYLYFR